MYDLCDVQKYGEKGLSVEREGWLVLSSVWVKTRSAMCVTKYMALVGLCGGNRCLRGCLTYNANESCGLAASQLFVWPCSN